MGLLIQPIVGAASDKTWNKFGRRNPYILIGAISATFGMLLMPNAPLFISIITPMIFGEKLCEIHVILRYKCRSLTNVICDMFLLASRLRGPKFTKNMIDHGRINSNQLDRAAYDRIQTCQFWEHLH